MNWKCRDTRAEAMRTFDKYLEYLLTLAGPSLFLVIIFVSFLFRVCSPSDFTDPFSERKLDETMHLNCWRSLSYDVIIPLSQAVMDKSTEEHSTRIIDGLARFMKTAGFSGMSRAVLFSVW